MVMRAIAPSVLAEGVIAFFYGVETVDDLSLKESSYPNDTKSDASSSSGLTPATVSKTSLPNLICVESPTASKVNCANGTVESSKNRSTLSTKSSSRSDP